MAFVPFLISLELLLYLLISSHDDINHLQSEIDSLSSWCKLWSLKLNSKNVLF